MGSIFQFKQFDVDQRDCAMKINTDGVLLAATVAVDNPIHILDIGTGTGVIAMMLAQRFLYTHVDAVEIDEMAFQRAVENFSSSAFADRISGHYGSYEILDGLGFYDLIISNPPFYTNALHNPDARKKLARHADVGFFDNLIQFAIRNLSNEGQISLILPNELAEYVEVKGTEFGLFVHEIWNIRSYSHTDIIRKIITLKKSKPVRVNNSDFHIYDEKGVYSSAYQSLLQPFFLAF